MTESDLAALTRLGLVNQLRLPDGTLAAVFTKEYRDLGAAVCTLSQLLERRGITQGQLLHLLEVVHKEIELFCAEKDAEKDELTANEEWDR